MLWMNNRIELPLTHWNEQIKVDSAERKHTNPSVRCELLWDAGTGFSNCSLPLVSLQTCSALLSKGCVSISRQSGRSNYHLWEKEKNTLCNVSQIGENRWDSQGLREILISVKLCTEEQQRRRDPAWQQQRPEAKTTKQNIACSCTLKMHLSSPTWPFAEPAHPNADCPIAP